MKSNMTKPWSTPATPLLLLLLLHPHLLLQTHLEQQHTGTSAQQVDSQAVMLVNQTLFEARPKECAFAEPQ